MGYPNHEVRQSFLSCLLFYNAAYNAENVDVTARNIGRYLSKGDIDGMCEGFRSVFASIPYNMFLKDREAYYQTVVYLVLSIMGVKTACEIQTNKGRIDAVLETDDRIYVVEFKLGTAQEAIDQIQEKDYAGAYRNREKPLSLLGIGLDVEKSNIGDWLCLPDQV